MINARNQIVFGTDKGFIEISPKEMQKSTYVPPIVFTGLKVQGQSSVIAIDDLEELRLKPSQRNVTFQFAALDYVDSKEIRYAYRLKGLEEEWHDGDKTALPATSTCRMAIINCKSNLPTVMAYG